MGNRCLEDRSGGRHSQLNRSPIWRMPRLSIIFGRFLVSWSILRHVGATVLQFKSILLIRCFKLFQAVPTAFCPDIFIRLCKLFSGYIAPWLYCLKTWVSSSRLNSQISLAVVRIFWLYCPLARYIARSYIAKLFWDRNVALPSYLARLYYLIFLAT